MDSPTRWQQVREILEQVLDHPEGEQQALAAKLCGDNQELYEEVLEYIDVSDQTNQVAPRSISSTMSQLEPLTEGEKLGAYRVGEELGQGGMGVVYRGKREDGVSLDVAIKVLKRGVDTREVVNRFLRERQILADLQHPNIARFLDSGTTDDGLPYFVMEMVVGEPVDYYCDSRKLGIQDRLKLFLKVCNAIGFAHRNMVTHRDIKPSNILVTAEGEPKLLDFGIAGVLNPLTMAQQTLTALEMRMMTPTWAAPEQVRGDRLTAACDVYALGLLLYRLLCGRFPYNLKSQAPHIVMSAIMEQPAEKPGKALTRQPNESVGDGARAEELAAVRSETSKGLQRRLRGDLDNICLTALEKEPEDRYESADALRDDIKRYLKGFPVLARKPTPAYRAMLYLRRNKLLLGAGVLVMFISLAFIFSLSHQQQKTAHERDTANKVIDIMINMFEDTTPERRQGKDMTAGELLDRGAQTIVDDLEDEPEVQTRLMATMSKAYMKLGEYDSARHLAEKALDKRRLILRQEGKDLAESLLDLAVIWHEKGDYDKAETHYSEALATALAAGSEQDLLVARIYSDFGSLRYAQGRIDDARSMTETAQRVQSRYLPKGHPDLTQTRTNMASIYYMLGRFTDAELLYREELAVKQEKLGRQHPDTLHEMSNLAATLKKRGDLEQAEELLHDVAKRMRLVMGANHPSIVRSLANLADVLGERNKLEEAETVYREALKILQRGQESDPRVARFQRRLGVVLTRRGKLDEAEAVHRRALQFYADGKSRQNWQEGATWVELGLTLAARSDERRTECESHILNGLIILKTTLGESHSYVTYTRGDLGVCLAANGKWDQALKLARESADKLKATSYEEKARNRLTDLQKRGAESRE